MISQERIDEIARDAVVEAIRDLAHERMGLSERLEAYWAQDVSEDEMGADMDRLEAAIRLHLPSEEDDGAPDVHCTMCGGDHDATPPDDDEGPEDGI